MQKKFEVKLPNEPFVSDTSLGKKVTCTYTGARYMVISVNKGIVQNYEHLTNNLESINLEEFVNNDDKFYIIDAEKHPLMCAFMNHSYTNEEVPDYEERLPSGEVYIYPYPSSGILDAIFERTFDVKYYPESDSFSELNYLKPIEKEVSDAGFQNVYNLVNEDINSGKLNLEDLKAMQDFKLKLDQLSTKYAGVKHWKIPFPSMPVYTGDYKD